VDRREDLRQRLPASIARQARVHPTFLLVQQSQPFVYRAVVLLAGDICEWLVGQTQRLHQRSHVVGPALGSHFQHGSVRTPVCLLRTHDRGDCREVLAQSGRPKDV
jgi:hypothetical protein